MNFSKKKTYFTANLHYLDNNGKDSQCSEVTKPIWGVVGAPSSITSIQVSNLLRLFKIPMVSFQSSVIQQFKKIM